MAASELKWSTPLLSMVMPPMRDKLPGSPPMVMPYDFGVPATTEASPAGVNFRLTGEKPSATKMLPTASIARL